MTDWKQLLEKRRIAQNKSYLLTEGNTPSGIALETLAEIKAELEKL